MKLSAGDPVLEHVAVLDPLRAHDVAREARVVAAGGGEGGEVVAAGEQRGAGVERVAVAAAGASAGGATLVRRARRGGSARGSGRCASVASRRASKPSGASSELTTATSTGRRPFSRWAGIGVPGWLATCPRACTPASVRPATVSVTGSRAMVAMAASSVSCTVRRPGWVAQPAKSVPSYSMSSRAAGSAGPPRDDRDVRGRPPRTGRRRRPSREPPPPSPRASARRGRAACSPWPRPAAARFAP